MVCLITNFEKPKLLSNDHVAIVHAEISKETEQALVEVLKVEVFRLSLGENTLVSALTNTKPKLLQSPKTLTFTKRKNLNF